MNANVGELNHRGQAEIECDAGRRHTFGVNRVALRRGSANTGQRNRVPARVATFPLRRVVWRMPHGRMPVTVFMQRRPVIVFGVVVLCVGVDVQR